MNILGLISQLIGIKTLRLTKMFTTNNIHMFHKKKNNNIHMSIFEKRVKKNRNNVITSHVNYN